MWCFLVYWSSFLRVVSGRFRVIRLVFGFIGICMFLVFWVEWLVSSCVFGGENPYLGLFSWGCLIFLSNLWGLIIGCFEFFR